MSTVTVRIQPYLPYRVTCDSLRAFARQQARVLDPGWGTPLDLGLLTAGLPWPRAVGLSITPIYDPEPQEEGTISSSVKMVTIGLPDGAGIIIRRVQEPRLPNPDAAVIGVKVVTNGLPDDCKLMLECNVGPDPPYLELIVNGPDAAVATVIAAFRQTFAVRVPFPSQISTYTALDSADKPQTGIVRWNPTIAKGSME